MKVSKHLMFACLLSVGFAGVTSSCDDDNDWKDVDGAAPVMTLDFDATHVEPGMDISITGKIADADGIAAIKLECPELYLDKTIDIIAIYGSPLKEYDLDYKVQTSRVATKGENFVVDLSVTDVGGRTTTKSFGANLDADFTAPYFNAVPGEEITVLIKNDTKIKLNVEIADNRVVDYLEIKLVKVNGTTETTVDGYPIRIEGGKKRLSYNEAIPVPGQAATYKVYITGADREVNEPAHIITSESKINVMELPNFDAIYLCDVDEASQLNSDVFGVPVAMDHVGDYKYRVRYYNAEAGTSVCFLGQKTDFGPICFAPSIENPAELGDDPDEVKRITLDEAGVYYEFFVDTWNRTFTKKTYSPDEAISPVQYLLYHQDYLWTWSDNWEGSDWMQRYYFGPATGPGDVADMEQDSKNPHLFTLEWKLDKDTYKDGDDLKFIIHNWHSHGWWNYTSWRVDNSADPSKCEYYGLWIPDNKRFTGNANYFAWKYNNLDPAEFRYMYPNAQQPVTDNVWSSEDNRKAYVPDNWVRAPHPGAGTYKVVFDTHAERIRMVKK